MTIIDLGEVTTTEFEPPRPAPRRLTRKIALAMVALLTLVTVTASVTPQAPRGVRPLWSVPLVSADSPFLTEDTLYLARDGGALTAYDVADGAERWTTDAGDFFKYPDLVAAGDVVLQPYATAEVPIDGSTVLFTKTTVALDRATGARLWKQDAGRVQIVGDRVLMEEHDATGRVTRIRMVRLRDGGTVWSRTLIATSVVTASDDVVVTVGDHNEVTVLRWADGSVLRTRTLSGTFDRLQDSIGVVGDVLIVGRSNQTSMDSAVYQVDTLAEVWDNAGFVDDCEPVLCSVEGDGVVGRDPLTGAERWRLRGVDYAYAIGSDRLLADTPSDADGQLLIDAGTGRTVAALSPGQLTWSGERQGPLLLVQAAFEAPLHVTVVQIDRATGEEFTLGALGWMGDGNASCQAAGRYLACPGRDQVYVTALG